MQTNTIGGAAVNAPAVNASGASWGAILAGAAAAAALSLVLIILGTGLGLATSSPWANQGVEASTLGVSSIAWILATQLAASALGGYLAGRLRVKWPEVQRDEVFFRDTAHGLLTWAVASLFTAAFLGSALTNAIGTGVQAGAMAAGSAGVVATQAAGAMAQQENAGAADKGETDLGGASEQALDYFVGGLFRSDQAGPAQPGDSAAAATEATTIFAYSLHRGQLAADDKTRLGQLIAQQTGLAQADAEKRAADIYYRASTELANAEAAARDAAEKARKAATHISLWLFIALLGGAFVASYAATIGGRQRDY
jgi:hypothetical protein